MLEPRLSLSEAVGFRLKTPKLIKREFSGYPAPDPFLGKEDETHGHSKVTQLEESRAGVPAQGTCSHARALLSAPCYTGSTVILSSFYI